MVSIINLGNYASFTFDRTQFQIWKDSRRPRFTNRYGPGTKDSSLWRILRDEIMPIIILAHINLGRTVCLLIMAGDQIHMPRGMTVEAILMCLTQ